MNVFEILSYAVFNWDLADFERYFMSRARGHEPRTDRQELQEDGYLLEKFYKFRDKLHRFLEDIHGEYADFFYEGVMEWWNENYERFGASTPEVKDTQVFSDMDWNLLANQKEQLLKLMDWLKDEGFEKELWFMEGLVSLVDHIQDYEVDVNGRPEGEVFPNLER